MMQCGSLVESLYHSKRSFVLLKANRGVLSQNSSSTTYTWLPTIAVVALNVSYSKEAGRHVLSFLHGINLIVFSCADAP